MIYSANVGEYDEQRDDIKVFRGYRRFKDDTRNARMYKALSHLWVDDEWSVWIDANLHLKVSESELIKMTKPHDVGVFNHTQRNCIYEEAEACKQQGKDDCRVIDEQMEHYKRNGVRENNGLIASFVVVRKHTDKIKRMNERWWSHITRFSKRDQLSFPVVFDNYKVFEINSMRNNEYFRRTGHK